MNFKNECGATLVEAIFAMLILSLIIVGLNAGVLTLIRANVSSKELSAATSNAYSLMEDLKNTAYADIVTSSDLINGKYLRSWCVTTGTAEKKIDVTVSWPITSYKHSIQLSTIISKP